MVKSTLKPCPCGETPTRLITACEDDEWVSAYGNCCYTWTVEFCINRGQSDADIKTLAKTAWNTAPRAANTTGE